MRTHKAKRNGPCLCGSGEKFKRCCLPKAKAMPDCVMFRRKEIKVESGPTISSSFSKAIVGKFRECGRCEYVKPNGKCKTGVK